VKKQHYVPRFYLKYFANEDKVDYYDKVLEKNLSNMHVDNVAQQKYFYDFSEEFLESQQKVANGSVDSRFFDKQFLEEHFSVLESQFARCFREINEKLNDQTNLLNCSLREILDEEDRIDLVFFIALQSIRVPAFRELSENFSDMLAENIPDFAEVKMDDNEKLLMHLASGILNRVGYYLLSDRFDWFLGVVEEFEEMESKVVVMDELVISDNPVVNIKHASGKTMQSFNEFCLPISPKHLLILREKNFPYENPDNSIFKLSRNDLRFYNEYQMRFSTRKVIYCNKTNAKKVKSFFKTLPRELSHNSGSIGVNEYEK
ncbi:DUF4238 domain-containing protein, partial [Bacillus cereus]|nr:DUF4238 domain-containing protein [Bacillus cereus]